MKSMWNFAHQEISLQTCLQNHWEKISLNFIGKTLGFVSCNRNQVLQNFVFFLSVVIKGENVGIM